MHAIWQSYPAWHDLAPHGASFDCDTLNVLRERIVPDLPARFSPQEVVGSRRRRSQAKAGQKIQYEEEILTHGRIPTRPRHPHDLYNALIWFTFPRAKMTLHRLAHSLVGTDPAPGQRSPVRQRLTGLDEGGLLLVVAKSDEQWARAVVKPAMPEEKVSDLAAMRHEIFVFGHGLIEVMVAKPTSSITALTMVIGVDDHFFSLPRSDRLVALDQCLSAIVEDERGDPERVGSLPAWLLT